jgi:hypothetical protein
MASRNVRPTWPDTFHAAIHGNWKIKTARKPTPTLPSHEHHAATEAIRNRKVTCLDTRLLGVQTVRHIYPAAKAAERHFLEAHGALCALEKGVHHLIARVTLVERYLDEDITDV